MATPNDGDGRVLATKIGLGPLLNRRGDLAHFFIAGRLAHQAGCLEGAVQNGAEDRRKSQGKAQRLMAESPPKRLVLARRPNRPAMARYTTQWRLRKPSDAEMCSRLQGPKFPASVAPAGSPRRDGSPVHRYAEDLI